MEGLPEDLVRRFLQTSDWKTARRLCQIHSKFAHLCTPELWINKILDVAPKRQISPLTPVSRLFAIGDLVSKSGTGYSFGQSPWVPGPFDTDDLTQLPRSFIPESVCQVSCGFSHQVWLTTNGEVYTQGSGSIGELGLGAVDKSPLPQKISQLNNIIQVAAGHFFTGFLHTNGDIYISGTIRPFPEYRVPHRTKITNVKQISGRGETIAYITDSGEVFAFGNNQLGLLGLDDRKATSNAFNFSHRARQVSIGKYHGLCLLENGDVYFWGKPRPWVNVILPPIKLPHLDNIIQVATSHAESAILTKEGKVYILKYYNNYGFDLVPISEEDKIIQISIFKYLLFLNDRNEAYLKGEEPTSIGKKFLSVANDKIALPFGLVTDIEIGEYQLALIIRN